MRALVTGATGFVGSHLAETLVRQGADVTALVRSPGKARLLSELGVRQVQGSLGNREALLAAASDQDVIFHVAGLVAARDENEFLRANRDGTTNLIEAALATGAPPRFVLVSSMAAGGPSPRGTPRAGHEPPAPVTAYGRSKLAGEEELRRSPLPWTILRPPLVYGPRDTEILKVFRLARTGFVPVFGDGSQELSAIYGPDLATALVAAARSPATIAKTYYACHPEVFSSGGFVTAVGRAVRGPRGITRLVPLPPWLARGVLGITGTAARLAGQATILTADKANEFFQPAWTGDPAALARDTGWSPEHGIESGLAATAEWYRKQGWL
ncbi:MAG: NAD(P)-dependent oxidoreductase [Gemmatimonadota bacterium]|nr:NAD(P)-dependent oxidoreductase [Gemmatimonadota bacterium]MDH5283891.1 NAD(P)-dependent oxidoreductase [Gemmatimonadota bacterium]